MIAYDSDCVAINRGVLDEANHLCFVGGSPEEWEGFDFAAVERNLGELPPEGTDTDEAAAELADLLRWLWSEPGNLRIARARFKALAREAMASPGTSRAAVAFEKIIRWCCPPRRGKTTAKTPFRRFVAICATFDPRLVAGKDYSTVAKELHITKASVSDTSRKFRDHFGYYSHEWRGAEGRENMRLARVAQRLPGETKAIARNTLRINQPRIS
jgi:hypothetical protein